MKKVTTGLLLEERNKGKSLLKILRANMGMHSFTGDYEFLSNSYKSCIKVNGISYSSVDSYLLAMKERNKTALFRYNWKDIKEDFMLKAIKKKFKNPSLRKKLLETDLKLVQKSGLVNYLRLPFGTNRRLLSNEIRCSQDSAG